MAWWNFKKEEKRDMTLQDILLSSNFDASTISKEQAMTIPSFNAGVNLISSIVASLPIKLYKKDGQRVKCMDDDSRVEMLNVTTGDLLDGFQMKKAMVEDHLIHGAGYMFINKQRNTVKSLNYVSNPQVGVVLIDPDPIFKKLEFVVYGTVYKDYQFVKLTRKTRDGLTGIGLLEEANKLLSVAYNTLVFEDMLVRTGGNKKGFLKAANKLSPESIKELKQAWTNLYANNSDNVVILNAGLDFKESNNSSVEMQINENKKTNFEEICKMLGIPTELLNGKATGGNELMFDSFIKLAILPILKAFESALNKDLLLEKEKGSYYFEFDTTDLVKADILKRYQAYDFAIRNGILQVDEVRAKENFEPLGLDFIKLGLQDVLFNPVTKEIYTPNTNKTAKMGQDPEENQQENTPAIVNMGGQQTSLPKNSDNNLKGGENIADRNSGESSNP